VCKWPTYEDWHKLKKGHEELNRIYRLCEMHSPPQPIYKIIFTDNTVDYANNGGIYNGKEEGQGAAGG